MIVGVPKEIKNNEFRVGMTPGWCRRVRRPRSQRPRREGGRRGLVVHRLPSTCAAGGEMVDTADEVFAVADMIVKVKEPQAVEIATPAAGPDPLHLPAPRPRLRADRWVSSGPVRSASPTRQSSSQPHTSAARADVRGRRSHGRSGRRDVPAEAVRRPRRAHGRRPGRAAGQGRRAWRAAWSARTPPTWRWAWAPTSPSWTSTSIACATSTRSGATASARSTRSKHNIEQEVNAADLVIGAVLLPGAKTPWLVTQGHAAEHEAGRGRRGRLGRPGRLHRDHQADDARGPHVLRRRRPALRCRQHAGRGAEHLDAWRSPTRRCATAWPSPTRAGSRPCSTMLRSPRVSTSSTARSPTSRSPRPRPRVRRRLRRHHRMRLDDRFAAH